jgi:hypothetical protein
MLENSAFTTRIFEVIGGGQVWAIMTESPRDVQLLQARLGCETDRFVLVNDVGLARLQQRDRGIRSLGQVNSAEITAKTILSPSVA